MKNEINKIRTAKAAGANEVAKILKPAIRFSYAGGDAEYSIEACMIARVVRELTDTFHADIARKINNGDKISDKQVFAVAAKFCELNFTFGEFKSANAHLFED